ncbi:hypothetical protein chiPu_0033481, partial [Chiloscyllium punctatum]|nr:hypothetical protein [Chiloscyllium punctatum]
MPRHMPADLGEVGFAGPGLVDERAVEHHDQPIRQLQELVEVFADQKHRRATVAGGHDLGMDLRHRSEVEPEAGIGGDQHFDVARQLACQHRALHVAAGERGNRR